MKTLKQYFLLLILLSGFLPKVHSQTGGGWCSSDSDCNFPIGGGCNGGTNSCVCVNGYTGIFCQTAPPAPPPSASPSPVSSTPFSGNNAILLISLASLFFWFLSNERSRQEEDWVFYRTLYQQELLQLS